MSLFDSVVNNSATRTRQSRGRHYIQLDGSRDIDAKLWDVVQQVSHQYGISLNDAGKALLAKGAEQLLEEAE